MCIRDRTCTVPSPRNTRACGPSRIVCASLHACHVHVPRAGSPLTHTHARAHAAAAAAAARCDTQPLRACRRHGGSSISKGRGGRGASVPAVVHACTFHPKMARLTVIWAHLHLHMGTPPPSYGHTSTHARSSSLARTRSRRPD
eukprot:512678-Prymnesium_polylepis.1